jgi:lysophospholipase L1-like esterase
MTTALMAAGAIILAMAAVALLAEIALRLFTDWRFRSIDPWAYRNTDVPLLHFEWTPSNRFANHYPARLIAGRPWSQYYEINARGIRGPEYPSRPPEGTMRIVCVGDSCTFGEGVDPEDTWPGQLERMLNGGADPERGYEVINTGVAGYDLAQKLAHTRDKCLDLHPGLLILGYSLNDPQLWPNPFVDERGLISFSGVLRFKKTREWVKNNTALGMWGGVTWTKTFGSQRLLPTYAPSSPEWIRARTMLRELRRMCTEGGFRLLVAILPACTRLDRGHPFLPIYRIVEAFLEEEGMPFVNLFQTVEGLSDREAMVQACDFHPSAEAYRRYAAGIHQALASHPAFNITPSGSARPG